MISEKLRTRIIVLVCCVWGTNFFLGLVPGLDYQPDQMINGIFMGVVGTVFVAGARSHAAEQAQPPKPPEVTPHE